MRTILWFSLILVLVPTRILAQTVTVDHVDIVSYGLFSQTLVKNEQRPGTSAGIDTVKDRKLIQQTGVITAGLGQAFGIEYVVQGNPQGASVMLTEITRFPPQGMVNSKGERLEISQFDWKEFIGKPRVRTYAFDNSWEMVPGDWVLEFYYQGRKLGAQQFKIVLP